MDNGEKRWGEVEYVAGVTHISPVLQGRDDSLLRDRWEYFYRKITILIIFHGAPYKIVYILKLFNYYFGTLGDSCRMLNLYPSIGSTANQLRLY